jgi:hypothetical protein
MVRLFGDSDAQEGAGQKARLTTPGRVAEKGWVPMSSRQLHTSLPDTSAHVSQHSPAAAKIALFRSLFRGRNDVYPRRFESRKTGKSGYAPACANEWVQGICEKPRIKCAVCPHRRFLPVTDDVCAATIRSAA